MANKAQFDILVIGGGIVGLASAYKISLRHPAVKVAVVEKEDKLAAHQTGHNSGVIHSGLYYKPGSAKAKTCVRGREELIEFAKEYQIPHQICGKIVVATYNRQLSTLEKLYRNGADNKVEGIEMIGPEQIKEIEPFCSGIAGIRVSCTGIMDFTAVANKLGQLIEENGQANRMLTGHEVTGFDRHDFYTAVRTTKGELTAKYIINCAGLQCDRIARMYGIQPGLRIVPFRGDYYRLTDKAAEKVKGLIYPVPDPEFPFLGIHFTRMIDGCVECGPNAVFSFKREGYGKTDFHLRDAWESLSYFGTWRLFMRHWRYGAAEYARASSKKLFLHQLRKLIPSLEVADITPATSGVRAQAIGPRGQLIDDFAIQRQNNSIHVLNAPSPAATASLAIGDYVNEVATEYFKL
jgi:L-2-hydroxyglutarate oxidase LhgO